MNAVLTTPDLAYLFHNTDVIDVTAADDGVGEENTGAGDESDMAYIIYTSGTTGLPKGVPVTYSSLHTFLCSVGPDHLDYIHAGSRILQFSSINFDVSIVEIIGALYYGATLVMVPEQLRNDSRLVYRLMCQERVTFASFTSSFLAVMPSMNLPDMQTLCSAGEPMIPSVARAGVSQHYRFVDAYGPTENTVYCISRDVDEKHSFSVIGKPFPYVTVYVVDEQMNEVKKGETGELLVGGRQLTQGYLNRPDLNESVFVANPFGQDSAEAPILYHTGDLVRMLDDGYIEYIGRKDSQVKLRGFRIELGEIRSRIEQSEDVAQAVVRLESFGREKHIAAYVMPSAQSVDIGELKKSLQSFLPAYMIPTFWIQVDSFKRNVNGKIDTSTLYNPQLERLTQNSGPLSQDEQMLCSVISRILGLDDVNVDADLMDEIGISSLQLMQTIQDLDFAGMYLSTKDFYEYRTIRRVISNHLSRPCYWYRDPVEGKPTLVIVSGYTSFMFLFPPLVERVCHTYNVFVIESYFEMGVGRVANVEELTEKYIQMLHPVISQYGVDVITGFCLGGEIGLYLAHCLHQRYGILPHVVVMDGEVKRDKDRRKQVEPTFTDFSPEINAYRFDQEMVIIETMPDFHYEGPVTSILAKQYSDRLSFNETDPISDEQKYWARVFFDRTPAFWKQEYPACELFYVDCDHIDYLRDERSVVPISDYFIGLDNKKTI
jgi:amino acid adenylation domain-containing protein